MMIKILTNNVIINKSGDWNFGKGYFVMVGDVFDGGDKVTECIWFLYRLEQEAEKVGGKVNYLLGNHEIMVLTGDLRYIHDKYRLVEQKFLQRYFQLFGIGTILGDWLRTKPITMSINDIQFVHGGLSPVLVTSKLTVNNINHIFINQIIDAVHGDSIYKNAKIKFLNGSQDPIWYRGYLNDSYFNETLLDETLFFFNKKHVVVGHTSMPKVEHRFDGKIIVVDSSIKLGEYGEILLIEDGHFLHWQSRWVKAKFD